MLFVIVMASATTELFQCVGSVSQNQIVSRQNTELQLLSVQPLLHYSVVSYITKLQKIPSMHSLLSITITSIIQYICIKSTVTFYQNYSNDKYNKNYYNVNPSHLFFNHSSNFLAYLIYLSTAYRYSKLYAGINLIWYI